MITQEGEHFVFLKKGFPHGEITDGDAMDRPDGSMELCSNMDYDVETGEVVTRNPTIDSGLLSGFTMPAGYHIMEDGFELFSFNQPIDKEVAMLFITNGTNVRIFINWDYNPPAPNTDPAGSNNDYENYRLYRTADTWYQGWIELTEYHLLIDFTKTGNLTFTVDNSALPVIGIDNYYRGWFAWNKTKYNSGITDQIKNESFVCIESYLESGTGARIFTIQNRVALTLNDLGWNTNDEIYLMRYPIMVHKATDTSTPDLHLKFSSVKMIKTATSINCLIGQDGNLKLHFLYKDNLKKDNHSSANFTPNVHKYYGWWLDYEMYPVDLTQSPIDVSSTGTTLYSNSIFGFNCTITNGSKTGYNTRHAYITGTLDFTTHIALMRMYQTVALGTGKILGLVMRQYHHYPRRVVGIESYLSDDDKVDADPTQIRSYYNEKILSGSTYIYLPSYSQFVVLDLTNYATVLVTSNVSFQTNAQYLPEEKIYNQATFGVYAQGRMFVSGDKDKPDNVKYSLFQKEDVTPLQNSRPIDAIDRDKNTAMSLLSINPVVFKGNSIHIANIEGQNEVGWRMLETKAQTGTNIPRSVVRTPSGVAFCNEQGIYLLQGIQEPLNLLLKRKRQAYLALSNKGSIFGMWYGKHNELWYYVGNKTFWICKLSAEEQQIGWKEYKVNFTPTGMKISDSGNLYIYGEQFIYTYQNDWEITNGTDADGAGIAWKFTDNYSLANSRKDKFHWIETVITIDYDLRTNPPIVPNGNKETITIKIYDESNVLRQTETAQIIVGGTKVFQIVFGNKHQDTQRALKLDISGTMNFFKRFKITELYTKIKPIQQTVREAYNKVAI